MIGKIMYSKDMQGEAEVRVLAGHLFVVYDKINELIDEVNDLTNWHDLHLYSSSDKAKEEWPQNGVDYWYMEDDGEVYKSCFHDDFALEDRRRSFGNCFRTREEAEAMRDKIKELLKK